MKIYFLKIKNRTFIVQFWSCVVLKHLNTSTAARGHIFKSICGPWALFTSKCGPHIDLSLRPLAYRAKILFSGKVDAVLLLKLIVPNFLWCNCGLRLKVGEIDPMA